MESTIMITFFKNKSLTLLVLMVLMQQTIQNEISLKFDKKKGSNIINYSYYSYISEVVVNGITGDINNYGLLLNEDINDITIRFNKYLDSCECMFCYLNGVLYIDFSNFISSKVQNMAYMFRDSKSLESLNFDNIDTSSVTDMFYMFYGCIELKSLNLNNFKTSSVTNMGYMFHYCLKLQSLNINNFDTSSVVYMGYMFSYCESLSSLNINNFNTLSVTNMEYMFQFCYLITSLNLNNFNTKSVKSIQGMFNLCIKLKSLDLNSFNTESVTDMSYMFSNCKELTSVKLDNFNTSSVLYMNHMFNGCNKLISLNLDNFNTSSLIDASYMFCDCYSLVSLNLTNFDFTTSIFNYMFAGVNNKLKYCIDDNKTYQFLDLIEKCEKNCKYVCIAGNSRTYIPEENLCINNCSMNEYYKYNYNNICYERCPNNTQLINNTYICKKIDNDESNTIKKIIYLGLIIVASVIAIIAIIVVIILLISYKKKSTKYKKVKEDNKEKSVELLKLQREMDRLQEEIKRRPHDQRKSLIAIIFNSVDQKFNFPVICEKTSIVKNIIKKNLYKEYPEYSRSNNYFMCNGIVVDISISFEENEIKNGDIILMNQMEDE